MPQATLGDVLRYLRKNCAVQVHRRLADSALLERYLAERDDDAFAVLMHRHGRMVLGICKRLLADSHDAEDCYQATFLVLAQRAASIRKTASLASWLYGVAHRIAGKARTQAASRRQHERQYCAMTHAEKLDDITWQELRSVLDEEVARLPEKHRAPIVLCYFEGKTHDQAAQELGWAKRTLTNRVTRGLEQLRKQLTRRGFALPAGVLAATLSEKALAAPVGAMLAINTAKAVTSVTAGMTLAAGCVSARAIALAEEAIAGAIWLKAKLIVLVLTLGFAAGGAGVAGYGRFAEKQQPAKATKVQPPAPGAKAAVPQKTPPPIPTDLYGDPLPEGALARLGTVRFRPGTGTFAITVSPDGKTVATGGLFGFPVSLWDAATGRPLHRLAAAMGTSVAFSPDGKMLFSCGERNSIFDVATGKELLQVGKDKNIASVAFSPDGKSVALSQHGAESDAIVHLYDVATGKELRELAWNYKAGSLGIGWPSIAFSPNGKIIASGSADKMVHLWDVATGKELGPFKGHGDTVWSVAFAPGGKVLASGGADGAIRLWNVDSSAVLRKWKVEGQCVRFVAFSQDGKFLVSASDSVVCLWDPETGKEIRKWHVPYCSNQALTLSPDGKVLFSVGYGAVQRWDTTTGKELDLAAGHSGQVRSLLFGPGGRTLFSCGYFDGELLEWHLANYRERVLSFKDPVDTPGSWWAVSDLSPDGKVVAYVRFVEALENHETAIRLWDLDGGKDVRILQGRPEELWSSVRFSPDCKLLASNGKDGVDLWDVATGKILHHIGGKAAGPVFSPDGLTIACAGADKTIQIWDTATGKKIRSWEGGGSNFAFSPDGKLLGATDFAGLRVWSAADGKELLRIGGNNWVRCPLAFSPSGRVVAVAASKMQRPALHSVCTIHFWDVQSGQEIRQFDAPQIWVEAVAMSHDGRTLASGGKECSILLWDLTGQSAPGQAKAAPLTAKDLAALWSDLADAAPKADRAIWTMVFAPQESLPYLKERLRTVPLADDKQVAKLAVDLDSETFAVRQKAAKALDDLGEAAEAALRKIVGGNIPLEARQRIEQILERRDRDALRKLRAVEALEQIGTAEARVVLEEMAKGSPNPRVREAAGAALKRIASRGV